MSMFTVRLSPEDEHALKALREAGVPIADLFRKTIHREYESRRRVPLRARQVRELIVSIDLAHPIPSGSERPPVDTLNRKAVREFIAGKLRKKGRE